jgi:hypothetical protein
MISDDEKSWSQSSQFQSRTYVCRQVLEDVVCAFAYRGIRASMASGIRQVDFDEVVEGVASQEKIEGRQSTNDNVAHHAITIVSCQTKPFARYASFEHSRDLKQSTKRP